MLKRFRLKHNYSQRQISELIGISRVIYSLYELGRIQLTLKDKIKVILFIIKFYLGVAKWKNFINFILVNL